MKLTVLVFFIISFLACLSITVDVPITKKHASPAVISFPFQRHHVRYSGSTLSSRTIQRRTGFLNQKLTNRVTFYTIDILIGTPNPQKITLLLDTGSSDTWVNTPSTDHCLQIKNICNDYGIFDPTKSRTFLYGAQEGLKVTYADHTFATGSYGKDTISIGDRALTEFQFGLATTTDIAHGTLGLGLRRDEEEILQNAGNGYPTFTQALFNQKFIKTKAYSLWLNDLHAQAGSIIFGGVDTAKFIGSLATFSLKRGNTLAVRLEGVSFQNIQSSSFDVTLDSGSQNTILPLDFVQGVWNTVHVVQGESGEPFVDCGLAALPTTMDFNFGSKTIRVPISQLVYKNPEGKPPPSPTPNVSYCSFGIVAVQKSSDTPVLGDTFLRSAYVVYDLSRKEISIAQAQITPKSTIVELDGTGVGKFYGSGVDSSQRPTPPATVANASPGTEDRPAYGNSGDGNDNNENDDNDLNNGQIPNGDFDLGSNKNDLGLDDDYYNPYNPRRRHQSTRQQSTRQRTAPGGLENLFAEVLAKLGDKFSFLKPFIT